MFSFIVRRLLYMPLVVFGVMLLTFMLFFVILSPQDMARAQLDKKATPEAIATFMKNRGLDKPRWLNFRPGEKVFDSLFFNEMGRFARLDLGKSYKTGEDLNEKFREGALPSLCITLPAFGVGLILAVVIALYVVLLRESMVDRGVTIACVALMSVVAMVYIISSQALFALLLKWFPVSGFDMAHLSGLRFLPLPVLIMVLANLGSDTRMYRAIFIEEISQDYVRTARAKGVSNARLLLTHVLKNGMIALITLVVAYLPFLIMGTILVENFFAIPGLGNVLVSALQTQDYATVMASVFLGSILYQIGLIATDICYAIADPRIRLS